MQEILSSSPFDRVLESIDALPLDDQEMVLDIVRQRLIQRRREELASEVREARNDLRDGRIQRGGVSDLMHELSS